MHPKGLKGATFQPFRHWTVKPSSEEGCQALQPVFRDDEANAQVVLGELSRTGISVLNSLSGDYVVQGRAGVLDLFRL